MDSSTGASQYQNDRINQVSARPYSNETGNRMQLHSGRISVVNSNNTYDVQIIGDDCTTVLKTYKGVFVPGNAGSYNVGDLVELKFTSKDYPTILATGGGGSTCSISVNTFGVKFG